MLCSEIYNQSLSWAGGGAAFWLPDLGPGLRVGLGSGIWAGFWQIQDGALTLSALPPALGLGSLNNLDLLTLGQLLTCPLLEFADRINQVGPTRGSRVVQAQDLYAKL